MSARDVFINKHWSFKGINMFRIFVCVVFVVMVSADRDGDMRKCHRLMRPDTLGCCKSAPKLDATIADDLKECLDLPMKPPSCEREECFAKKKGFYASDGSLDVKALEPILEKEFKDMPDMFVAIKEKCLNGDISKYGPPDMCDFMKMRHCIQVNLIASCPEWSDKDDCGDMKGLVADCLKPDADMRKCHRLMRPDALRCCSGLPKPNFEHNDDIKECFEIPRKPHCCEREVCVAQKLGFYEADDRVDKNALEPVLEKRFGDDPETLSDIKENCLNGDLRRYGPPHICDLLKMKHCVDHQWAKKCTEWSDEGECSGTAKLFEECSKRFE